MLLGAGGLAIGALGEPGPGVALPGGHGVATVAEVPAGREPVPTVLPVPAVVELEPMPLLVEELVLVEGFPAVLGVPVVAVPAVVVVPVPVLRPPLLVGVHGAVVVVVPVALGVPDCPVVVSWPWVPSVPLVTLPGLPATPGVPGVTEGVPVEVPGVFVVVPLWLPTVPVVVVLPGCEEVVVPVVCVPIPGLGVTDPVVWADATPRASTNTDDANKVFRIESCSLVRIAAAQMAVPRTFKTRFSNGMPPTPAGDGTDGSCTRIFTALKFTPEKNAPQRAQRAQRTQRGAERKRIHRKGRK
jgi:hypothetical protein